MKKIIDYIAEELADAFEKAGYDRAYGKVTLSNRPDLCEYQCNGAMAGAKAYKKAPFMIAEDVVALLKDSACMQSISDICLTTAFTRHRHSLRRCLYLRHIRRKILSRRAGLFQKDHKDEYTVIEYQPQNGACIASRQIRI